MAKQLKVTNALKELDKLNSVGASAILKLNKERAIIREALKDEEMLSNVYKYIFDGDYSEENVSPLAEIRADIV